MYFVTASIKNQMPLYWGKLQILVNHIKMKNKLAK